jgi:hypothetical protein
MTRSDASIVAKPSDPTAACASSIARAKAHAKLARRSLSTARRMDAERPRSATAVRLAGPTDRRGTMPQANRQIVAAASAASVSAMRALRGITAIGKSRASSPGRSQ